MLRRLYFAAGILSERLKPITPGEQKSADAKAEAEVRRFFRRYPAARKLREEMADVIDLYTDRGLPITLKEAFTHARRVR